MEEKSFVSYEYKTITVTACEQGRMADLNEAFGWEVTDVAPAAFGRVRISLRRDRKIRHRNELVKTERQAQGVCGSLDALKRSVKSGAAVFAYIFGVLGALALGGGMSLVMLVENSIPALVGGIILGLAGIAVCAVNYKIYTLLADKKACRTQPAIDENEEKLANLLERGNELLAAEEI